MRDAYPPFPHDKASFIEYFTCDHIIRHNGTRAEREPDMSLHDAQILAQRLDLDTKLSPGDLANLVIDRGLLMGGGNGWIDRDGYFWTCSWASHDTLLYILGNTPHMVEQAGWVRISGAHIQSLFEPSDKQLSKLLELGWEREAADLFKRRLGKIPRPADVKAARIVIVNIEETDTYEQV